MYQCLIGPPPREVAAHFTSMSHLQDLPLKVSWDCNSLQILLLVVDIVEHVLLDNEKGGPESDLLGPLLFLLEFFCLYEVENFQKARILSCSSAKLLGTVLTGYDLRRVDMSA